MPDPLDPIFALACAALAAGVLASLRVRVRATRLLGEPVHAELPGNGTRLAASVLLALPLALLLLGGGPESPWSVAAGLLALAVVWLRPDARDAVCGTAGVRDGWLVHRFGACEAWRLTGDHLRLRIAGRWRAVPLPRTHQERVARELRARFPERESELR